MGRELCVWLRACVFMDLTFFSWHHSTLYIHIKAMTSFFKKNKQKNKKKQPHLNWKSAFCLGLSADHLNLCSVKHEHVIHLSGNRFHHWKHVWPHFSSQLLPSYWLDYLVNMTGENDFVLCDLINFKRAPTSAISRLNTFILVGYFQQGTRFPLSAPSVAQASGEDGYILYYTILYY